jgi:hypothetical protein
VPVAPKFSSIVTVITSLYFQPHDKDGGTEFSLLTNHTHLRSIIIINITIAQFSFLKFTLILKLKANAYTQTLS